MDATREDILFELERITPIIKNRCIKTIPNYINRLQTAIGYMDREGIPFRLVDRELFESMQDVIVAYYDEQKICFEFDDDFGEIINSVINS
jgi:hypothetical protein